LNYLNISLLNLNDALDDMKDALNDLDGLVNADNLKNITIPEFDEIL